MNRFTAIKKMPFSPLVVLLILIFSPIVIDYSWKLPDKTIASLASFAGFTARGFLFALGTLLIYIFSGAKTASPKLRVSISLIPCYYWFFHQLTLHFGIYPVLEIFFIIFNPLFLLFISWSLFQIAVAEIISRKIYQKKSCQNLAAKKFFITGLSGMTLFTIITLTSLDYYYRIFEKFFS